jgi:hypothetical protein
LGIPNPDFELERDASEFPLDEEMGAGHLNAKRALQQFLPGEQEVNGNWNTPINGDVPLIGWDYGTIGTGNFPINKYALDTPLVAGNFIVLAMGLKPSPLGETFRVLYWRNGKLSNWFPQSF